MLRPNWAMDPPPAEIKVGGGNYAVNTDYRVWIEVIDLLKQWHSDAQSPQKVEENTRIAEQLQVLVFGGILADESLRDILMAIIEFSHGYPTASKASGDSGPELFSFKWDLNEILIAIRNQSGLDLSYRCPHFHWWEFLLEFRTLCGEHYFLKIMEVRGYKGKDKDMRKLQSQCALPVERSADEQDVMDEINAMFCNSI